MMRRYITWVVSHAVWVLTGVAIVTILLGLQLRHLYIDIDRKKQLPEKHPMVMLDDKILALFGGSRLAILAVETKPGDIFTKKTLEKIQRITEAVLELPGVIPANVWSITQKKVKHLKATADGVDITPLIGEIPDKPEDLDVIRARTLSDPLYTPTFVSRDGRVAAVLMDFEFGTPEKPGPKDPAIHAALEAIAAKERDAETDVHIGGIPVVLSLLDVYSRKMVLLFVFATLVIGLIHYEAFRTIQSMVLPLVTALMSVLWGLGILAYFRMPMDPWSAMTPILILAVAAGHAVQILKRYYEEFQRLQDNHRAIIESTVKVGQVMITAGLIAAAGLASLATFEIRSVRIFGIFAALGILSALIIEMTFIPACRALIPAPKGRELVHDRHEGWLERILDRLARLVGERPKAVLVYTLVFLAAALLFAFQVQVDNSLVGAFPADSPLRVDDEILSRKMGGTSSLNLLIEGKDPDALKDPKVLRAMERVQIALEELPGVGKTYSVVDLVKRMHQMMNGGDSSFQRIPDDKNLIAQYLFLYTMSGDSGFLDSMVDPEFKQGLIRASVKSDRTAFARSIFRGAEVAAAGQFPPGVTVGIAGGTIGLVTALNEVIIHEKIINFIQVVTILFVITAIVLRSFLGGFLVLVPSFLSAAANMGAMGATGTWLSMGTAAITALSVSIGADYGIYFIFRFREELGKGGDAKAVLLRTMATSGKAIFFVASAVALGYAVLLFSGFVYHKHMGGLFAVSMIVCSLAATSALPAFILVFRPKFLFGRAKVPAGAPVPASGRP